FASRRAPPPGSTPFPYTTLFRSTRGKLHTEASALERRLQAARRSRPERRAKTLVAALVPIESRKHSLIQRMPRAPCRAAIVVERDRKSTRLNSSHVKSSYAVFCL